MNGQVVRSVTVVIGLISAGASSLACSSRLIDLGGAGTGGAGGGFGGGAGYNGGAGMPGGWQVLPDLGAHKTDVLFMIDNSASMQPLQLKLKDAFPAFVSTLQALPNGQPDLHIAVISSDTGPGIFELAQYGCHFTGDGGRFQFAPRGDCTVSPLLPGQTFLGVVNGVPTYTGGLADALKCIAQLGDQGCGFEGPLKSIRWALDPVNTPNTNQGFLRPEALLAVVLVTNEDDCSLPDDSKLADPAQTKMSDPLGPFWSFRCNEFGHLCNIGGHLVPPPRGAADGLTGCQSNESPTGQLTHLTDEAAFLRSLKTNSNQLMMAAIAGPTTPYGIEMVQDNPSAEAHPVMKHSCQWNGAEYADPPVRIKQLVDGFGPNGMMLPICGDSLQPQLTTIAQAIGNHVGYPCVAGPFPTSTGSMQPSCRVIDNFSFDAVARQPNGQVVRNCVDTGGATPCWTTSDDLVGCSAGTKALHINRGTEPMAGGVTAFSCAPCPTDHVELGCSP